jgi:hypothetical protein
MRTRLAAMRRRLRAMRRRDATIKSSERARPEGVESMLTHLVDGAEWTQGTSKSRY